jgi:O-methyltransferase domain/Dimerisation domain
MNPGRDSEEQQSARRMVQLLNAHVVAQALYVAAQLGLADLLREGAKSVDGLADATGAHAASLHRLLRMLAGEGVFREVRDGEFALTALGETLRSDSPNSVRARALYLAAPEVWAAWGQMRHSVTTGEAAFEHLHGVSFYAFMSRHRQVGEYFNGWMTRSSELDNAAVVASYDFSQFRTVVDVGGGHGATLAAILWAYPSVRGVLFDLPHVVSDAKLLEEPALAGRCQITGGDMIEAVPAVGDAYIIKMVLNGESDERAVALLANCLKAMGKGGRLVVIDVVMPSGDEPSPSRSMDLFLLTLFRGRIRTELEFRALFASAGLSLRNIITTGSISNPMSILEGVPA